MKAYTDYPFYEYLADLGEGYVFDRKGYKAPIREVEVVSFDGDKYCLIRIPGLLYPVEVKWGYLYTLPGRLGEVPTIDVDLLPVDPSAGTSCDPDPRFQGPAAL